MASPASRPLRVIRLAPDHEVLPERAAEVSVLAPVLGEDAARVRHRWTRPDGWVAVHLGVLARTRGDGNESWLEGEHATYWVWPALEQAERYMHPRRRQGTTVLVVRLWSPAREPAGREFVEIGAPLHDDPVLRGLSWAVLRSDVPNSWAHRDMTGKLTWRNDHPGEAGCFRL